MNHPDQFVNRHIGVSQSELNEMFNNIGVKSLDELIDKTVPSKIRLNKELEMDEPVSEYDFLNYIRTLSEKNVIAKSYIGRGYNPTIIPPVIQRNILENPGWYTQYTPYQAEISQGRLEALMNYQTMVTDLCGLPIANASLLDEGTAAAEAMIMLYHYIQGVRKNANKMFIYNDVFDHTVDVLKVRALPLGIEIETGDIASFEGSEDYFAVLVQYPAASGEIVDFEPIINRLKSKKIYTIIAADLLALTLIREPGAMGADVVVGSSQRFGVPMGFGGPHAAFFATKEEFKRLIPGRIIGASVDNEGNTAFRMALQTREQHIRRDKATSNICTAQVLLAIMASMYAVYHGPEGLRKIALRIHSLTNTLYNAAISLGIKVMNKSYFDTLTLEFSDLDTRQAVIRELTAKGINVYCHDNLMVGFTFNELTNINDINELISVISSIVNVNNPGKSLNTYVDSTGIPVALKRLSDFLTHINFNKYHSETKFLRYVKYLESKDLSLTYSMIPLGSCTMKLNATSELMGITLPGFCNIHPFAPESQWKGYSEIIEELSAALSKITGFEGVSLQPNSGAQGEYAGLMVIKQYHLSRGNTNRNIVLIPSSAHGTNPASAVMAGMKVVVVNCDDKGNIDLNDLRNKAEQYKNDLSALMVTYPSTHGVFEEDIMDICKIVHENGGQVYMDGANMNAQVGLTSPAAIGADVCHLNLHKTFAIPHGGGGPGVGPICVADHLVPFLPSHKFLMNYSDHKLGPVSAAPFGSALILLISLGYIKMLGGKGITDSTRYAVLNANYLKAKLENYYKVLYTGKNGTVAHELIFDFRDFKKDLNIEVEDIAKRLMDYGFHAPTVSFPVPGTIMVEPTESESKEELDRFVEAMISIKGELDSIRSGKYPQDDNPLKNAPHTMQTLTTDNWTKPYSREEAVFPTKWTKKHKFWPSVARINNTAGDRNLVCSCNPISDYFENLVEVN
ncbi:MAG: aminomethyl-transferring glycine dehydrogenase [Ignavibacteriaceae bacterium]|nr:aminomethyl-transferring glycine dehydrogenase [Ignavibacteriaceae bacterium]